MKLKGKVKFAPKSKSEFFPTLKKRVDAYFQENNISSKANSEMFVKSFVLISSYIFPFILLLLLEPSFGISLLLWSIMGFGLAGIGMSVMHDAIHGAYSSNKTVNFMMGNTLNLVGGSTFNWKLQHNILHHTYTNIVPIDEDIQDRLVLRFSPHTKVKFYHKFQWLYAFMFYGMLTFYWVLLKDFIQFFQFKGNGVNPNTPKQNAVVFTRIAIMKVIYFFSMLVAPTLLFGIPFLEILAGFLLMHFISGIILTTVFQLAHTVEGTAHPIANESGNIENDWAIHQLNTTVNFSRNNKFLSWYVGGLNFQIEHHLFPKVCHVHYPHIAEIVKQTATEFGIPYMENKTFGLALQSHINTLRRFGKLPSLNEAIG